MNDDTSIGIRREIKITLAKQQLPETVKSLCEISGANEYLIVINDSLNADEQAKAFLHECRQIYSDSFDVDGAVNDLEEDKP